MTGRASTTQLAKILSAAVLPMPPVAIAVLQLTPNAFFAADEFFKASISKHTRRAYGRIVGRFLTWCDQRWLAGLT